MNEKKKEPLFHIVKRGAIPWYQNLAIHLFAIVLALVLCAIVTTITTGINPVDVFKSIFSGAFGSTRKTWVTLQNVSILLLIIALIWLLRKKELPRLVQWGAGLMGGGALGNLFDRIFYGHVIDMLDVIFLDFFIFNPADVGVVLGAALLGMYLLKGESTHT